VKNAIFKIRTSYYLAILLTGLTSLSMQTKAYGRTNIQESLSQITQNAMQASLDHSFIETLDQFIDQFEPLAKTKPMLAASYARQLLDLYTKMRQTFKVKDFFALSSEEQIASGQARSHFETTIARMMEIINQNHISSLLLSKSVHNYVSYFILSDSQSLRATLEYCIFNEIEMNDDILIDMHSILDEDFLGPINKALVIHILSRSSLYRLRPVNSHLCENHLNKVN
jgi:hypothetical protein